MRLALSDIKKTISRKHGAPRLIPYLLRPADRTRELQALIAVYDTWPSSPRAAWPEDRAAELIGDYRLARCLEMVLAEWYAWQSPAWPEGDPVAAALAARGITTPSQLRLALYDAVSATHGGFLAAGARDAALDAFAAELAISRAALDDLLYLDSDARAMLVRTAPEAPTAAQLATRFNQRVFEALLASAAQVEWLLTPDFAQAGGESLGTIVKRVCFLARRMGIQYDVAFAESDAQPPLPRVAEERGAYLASLPGGVSSSLTITLYGPQEMTGAATQYGERLARLCRVLLGYRRGADRTGRAALAGAGLSGTAHVYLHGRPLAFDLDAKLLKLIAPAGADDSLAADSAPDADPQFDSALERRLHAQFAALEREGEARGWRLEREPEPILAGATILVPDFALTRGPRRVYLEVAGYWRPEYRERKVRKLTAVRGRVALVLAAPESARAELAALESDFPILWYKDYVSAEALLALLNRAYNDLDARLEALDLGAVLAELAARGHIAPTESMALLRCYSRSELARALDRLQDYARRAEQSTPEWVDGIGLCAPSWLAGALDDLRATVLHAAGQRLPLAELRPWVAGRLGGHAAITEGVVEMLAQRAGLHVARASIFDAVVLAEDADIPAAPPDPAPTRAPAPQPRQRLRRTHTRMTYTTQSIFPPEHPGPDNPEPDLPTRAT